MDENESLNLNSFENLIFRNNRISIITDFVYQYELIQNNNQSQVSGLTFRGHCVLLNSNETMCFLRLKIFYPSTLLFDIQDVETSQIKTYSYFTSWNFRRNTISVKDKYKFFIEIIKLRPRDAVDIANLRPSRFDCVFYTEGRRHGEL